MGCKDIHCPFHKLLLDKYIFNSISSKDEKKLKQHLEECSVCRKERDKIIRNNKILNSEVIPKVSEGFKEKVLKRLNIANTSTEYKAVTIKKPAVWSRLRLAAACVPIVFASLITLYVFTNKLSNISSANMNYRYEALLDKKYFKKVESLNKHINNKLISYLKKKKINYKILNSEVFMDVRFSKKIKTKRRWPNDIYTVIHISKEDKDKIKDYQKKISYFIKNQFNLDYHQIVLKIKPPDLIESKIIYILILLIILELIIRLLLIFDIRKQSKRKPLYIFSILLGSVFVPFYLFIRRKKIK